MNLMLGGKDVNSGLRGKNLSGFGKFSSYRSYKYFSFTVNLLVFSLTCRYHDIGPVHICYKIHTSSLRPFFVLASQGIFWLMIFIYPLSLAGTCAVWIVSDALEEKAEKELEMRQAWMQANNVTEVVFHL